MTVTSDAVPEDYTGRCDKCAYATATIHTRTGWFCETLCMMTRPDSCCGRYVNSETADFRIHHSMPI